VLNFFKVAEPEMPPQPVLSEANVSA